MIRAVYIGYDVTSLSLISTLQVAAQAGYNVLVLAFWIDPVTGVDPYSSASFWEGLSSVDRSSTLTYLHGLGVKVMLSAGGSTYNGYTVGGGSAYGQAVAHYANTWNYDGVDFDMENFQNGFTTSSGLTLDQSVQWLVDATVAARAILGADKTISHAPQSPYFCEANFASGYLRFYQSLIASSPTANVAYFLIQYYNQGSGAYQMYETQFIASSWQPGTAVNELITRGLPKEKIVVGRLTQPGDGSSDTWLDPTVLGHWVQTSATDPSTNFWQTGVSAWQYHATGSPTSTQWIQKVYPSLQTPVAFGSLSTQVQNLHQAQVLLNFQHRILLSFQNKVSALRSVNSYLPNQQVSSCTDQRLCQQPLYSRDSNSGCSRHLSSCSCSCSISSSLRSTAPVTWSKICKSHSSSCQKLGLGVTGHAHPSEQQPIIPPLLIYPVGHPKREWEERAWLDQHEKKVLLRQIQKTIKKSKNKNKCVHKNKSAHS